MSYLNYIEDVLSGDIITGEFLKLAINRHLSDLKRQNTEGFPYYFDEKEGQRYIDFAHLCRHWKGEKARESFKLESHQQFYFMMLFGWLRKDGGRRFRTSYKQVARKNGKTSECALKALAHLKLDDEAGAQVYFAATKEDQARIAFTDVQEIIKATPNLGNHFKIFTKSVTRGASFIKPLGSDSNTSDGFDPSYGVIDEYHAHPDQGMLNVLESGMAARKSPLIDIITTAGYNKDGPCYSDMRRTSIEILRGIKTDDTHLALIYELDKDDDWQDETNWIKANPNLGVSVKLDFLRDRFLKAKNEGGSKEIDFKTKNLNIWTDSSATWITDDTWMGCDFGAEDHTGGECYGGLDMASTRDITALVLYFPGEVSYIEPYFFIPELTAVERVNKDGVNYDRWIRSGHMIETEGNVTDYNFVKAKIMELAERYRIKSIAYDRWNASQLVIDLTYEGIPMSPFGQGFASMSAPTKELEKLVHSKAINHAGNPVLRWMNSNIQIQTDPAGNIKINKAKSSEKVDGMVALAMALGETMTDERPHASVYDDPNYEIPII